MGRRIAIFKPEGMFIGDSRIALTAALSPKASEVLPSSLIKEKSNNSDLINVRVLHGVGKGSIPKTVKVQLENESVVGLRIFL